MWLVLCDRNDAAGVWIHSALRSRGLAPLGLVTGEDLAFCDGWEHRVGRSGATIRFRLESGLTIRGEDLRGVVNRLYTAPIPQWRSARKVDREYVQQELLAFHMSWLHALRCPVLNRPTPQGLCGQWRPESEWVWLAQKAGLQTPRYRQSTRDRIDEASGQRRLLPPGALVRTAIVVEGIATGERIPPAVAEGCRRLWRLAGSAFLGIDFAEGAAGPWTFAGATPVPDLRLGGELLAATVLARLTAPAAST